MLWPECGLEARRRRRVPGSKAWAAKTQPGPSAPALHCCLRLYPCLPGPASGTDAVARKMPDRFLSPPTFFPSLNWTIAM